MHSAQYYANNLEKKAKHFRTNNFNIYSIFETKSKLIPTLRQTMNKLSQWGFQLSVFTSIDCKFDQYRGKKVFSKFY